MYPRPQPRPYQTLPGTSVPAQPVRPLVAPQPRSEEDLRLLPLQVCLTPIGGLYGVLVHSLKSGRACCRTTTTTLHRVHEGGAHPGFDWGSYNV